MPGLREGVDLMCCAKGGMVSIQEKKDKIICTRKWKEKDKYGISPSGGNMGSYHFYLSKCHFV